MEHVRFGTTGLKVSRLCLGTMSLGSSAWKGWVLDEAAAVPILRRALDRGITFFDMADWYSLGRGEEVVGRNLLKMEAREQLVLATKVFYPMSDDPNDAGLSRQHILASIDQSLQAHRDRPRRSLHRPRLRSGNADRGDHAGAARRRPRGQGALPRRLDHVRLAVRRDERGGPRQRLDAVRQHAVPAQPALSRGGARDAALLRARRRRGDHLQPARARLSGRRCARARARRTTPSSSGSATRSTSRSQRACARSPSAAARRRPPSPWPGSPGILPASSR